MAVQTLKDWLPAGVNVVVILVGCIWMYDQVSQLKIMLRELEWSGRDRLTGSMFIEIQDRLADKNPQVKWLSAKDVREVQKSSDIYRRK